MIARETTPCQAKSLRERALAFLAQEEREQEEHRAQVRHEETLRVQETLTCFCRQFGLDVQDGALLLDGYHLTARPYGYIDLWLACAQCGNDRSATTFRAHWYPERNGYWWDEEEVLRGIGHHVRQEPAICGDCWEDRPLSTAPPTAVPTVEERLLGVLREFIRSEVLR